VIAGVRSRSCLSSGTARLRTTAKTIQALKRGVVFDAEPCAGSVVLLGVG
jgi:hypothetical protein